MDNTPPPYRSNQSGNRLLSWLLIMALGLSAVGIYLYLNGCTTLAQAIQLEDMSDEDYRAWRDALTSQIATVAEAAYQEGDLSAHSLEVVASGLATIGVSGAGDVTAFVDALDLKGYEGAALKLALLDLSKTLAQAGGAVDGVMGERARDVLTHLGAKLSAIAP
jgi:hypothetical protein